MTVPLEIAPDGRPAPPPTGLSRLKARADRFIHHPVTELTLVGLILVSVALLVAETAFDQEGAVRQVMEDAGDWITWLFVAELSVRWWVAPKKRRFFRRYWLDILAVLPTTRALRLFRVVRLLRLFRAGLLVNRRLAVFRGVFRGAGGELTVLATVTTILVLAAAVVLHLGERSVNADFADLEHAVWYAVYSLIGGEPIGGTPVTELGRAVTLVLILGGLTVFGMFVGTVSASMVSRLSRRLEVNEMDLDELSGHVIICGWNHSAPTVVREIVTREERRQPVVIITEHEGMPEDVPLDTVPRELLYHVSGDYTRVEVLEQAAASRAVMALLLSDKSVPRTDQDRDARTVLAALTIERIAPGIFTCAELRDRQNETLLRRAGVEEIVVADEYSGFILGSVGRNRGLVATLDEILSTRYGNAFHKAVVPDDLDGTSVGELHTLLKDRYGAVLVSVERQGGPAEGRVLVNPPVDHRVGAGDHLVVITTTPIRWS